MRSIPTARASAITWPTSAESGAVFVTISKCACASTQKVGSASGAGASGRSISRLWRSAIAATQLLQAAERELVSS